MCVSLNKLSGRMLVYQCNRLREVVNLQMSSLDSEGIAYVRLDATEWGPPFSLQPHPLEKDWNASEIG